MDEWPPIREWSNLRSHECGNGVIVLEMLEYRPYQVGGGQDVSIFDFAITTLAGFCAKKLTPIEEGV